MTFLREWAGSWKGPSSLHLDWPVGSNQLFHCESTLETTSTDDSATLVIGWSHEGEPHTGKIEFTIKDGISTGTWQDTWHQPDPLGFDGRVVGESVQMIGYYDVGEGPPWGWRIELGMSGAEFKIEMTNVSPDGEEDWAVRAEYARC